MAETDNRRCHWEWGATGRKDHSVGLLYDIEHVRPVWPSSRQMPERRSYVH